jgi:hypothetical protein
VTTTPPVDLDRIEALLSKATDAPWHRDPIYWTFRIIEKGCFDVEDGPEGTNCPRRDDADLIAELRNAAPAMVAELRALRAAVAAMRPFAGHADVGQTVCDSFFGNPCDCGWQEVEDAIPKGQP